MKFSLCVSLLVEVNNVSLEGQSLFSIDKLLQGLFISLGWLFYCFTILDHGWFNLAFFFYTDEQKKRTCVVCNENRSL